MNKILVLDDDPSNADAIRMVLEDQLFQVECIHHSEALHATVNSFAPDLIVMDILLDQGDGRELCNSLKNDPETKDIPILLITAMLEAQALTKKNLADVLMYKPFDYDVLCNKVCQLIST
ncbi:CheY-like chemotaxis protein [Pedobacter sp. W3I1]|uniref:response regulator n=1 Tax=Pedobacter sp. W3I1 TaxID=3042291 RepID=UPI0027801A28|nr:response regulator [Pedobacter sp. W3I1]MDQ0639965.1 CheY-like chemotaxis protein [Pedobacter sp. W3I1]